MTFINFKQVLPHDTPEEALKKYIDGSLTEVDLTKYTSLTSISDDLFTGLNSLSSIILPSSITSITSGAFANLPALKKVRVRSANGTVAGAPWGFDDAKIVYNVTLTPPTKESSSSSSSSTSAATNTILVSNAGTEAANGTYILTSGEHGTQTAVYKNSSNMIISFENVMAQWRIQNSTYYAYYYATTYGGEGNTPVGLTYKTNEGNTTNIIITDGSASSSSSSSEESSSSSSESSTPSVIVTGASDAGANGTYVLTSGTHGTGSAVYQKGSGSDYYYMYCAAIWELSHKTIDDLLPVAEGYWNGDPDEQQPPWNSIWSSSITVSDGSVSSSSSSSEES